MEIKSYRGKLIRVIVDEFITNHQYEPLGAEKILREKLNLNLKFETHVSDFKIANGVTFGNIYYTDEQGNKLAMGISIQSTVAINQFN